MRYSLLVFREHELIGEYSFSTKSDSANTVTAPLRRLNAGLSGVVLSEHGIVAHSVNLPKDNVWYRELVLQVAAE